MGTPADHASDSESDSASPPLAPSISRTTIALPTKMLEELQEAVAFERDVRRLAKVRGSFKFVDMMRFLLRWALKQYWLENGVGRRRPTNPKERQQALHAAIDQRTKRAVEQATRAGTASE